MTLSKTWKVLELIGIREILMQSKLSTIHYSHRHLANRHTYKVLAMSNVLL